MHSSALTRQHRGVLRRTRAMDTKVYTVNGATASSSSSLPDWLTRKRAAKGKGKRAIREHYEGTLELIQGFEFPEASNRIKTTRDGQHVVATGTYKPQMRVWDLSQLSLKFERHSDAENVDFVMLSDDWTKAILLQNDRTVELHTQGGFHYRTRIPRFGRSIAYHFPSCDALVSASGNEIYRLNLEQGRFMTPLVLQDDEADIPGVNVIDINPVHQLFAFGIESNGTAQFWDPRSRSRVGLLRLPRSRLLPPGSANDISVTAISSRSDGLSYALGTSTGHTLLYDIRAAQPFALKDQGYGLPVQNVSWIEGGSKMAGDGMVLSADKKVIKIWERGSPATNFVSITPAADMNDVHHVPGSGLLMTANEGIQMATYYIPQLGPAPRWASFLENVTEEMEDQTTRSVYEDYKFVERNELKTFPRSRPSRGNPCAQALHARILPLTQALRCSARHRQSICIRRAPRKMVREKMEKMAETRIRAKKDGGVGVKVNKALAEKILREAEREQKRLERKKKRAAAATTTAQPEDADAMDQDEPAETESAPVTLLNDPRFAKVFEDPAFAVDETSREFALLNPSAVAQRKNGTQPRGKTAVEDEEDESDKFSSDGLDDSDDDEDKGGDSDSDSSAAGALNEFDPRVRPGQKNARMENAYSRAREQNRLASRRTLVPMNASASGSRGVDPNATFGQRKAGSGKPPRAAETRTTRTSDGGVELTWVPSSTASASDPLVPDSRPAKTQSRKGVERFGAGMERGHTGDEGDISEQDRKGRTKRRTGVRSGSKNVFRRADL
ncbi:unnamed protein product [Mycena citricolor]|uniref:NUC153 domain-containing protein n=1 Tax=Mycena citricolor TaxID=2018698 RepID=A0AAD2Q577_9AGAR|nr:unnamed protein product [Mycena citricolor]